MSLGKIPEEKAEIYERSSWRVVGELKNDLIVLTTDDPDAPEIFSEPEHLIKLLKRLAKKHTAYYILLCLMAVLLLLEFVMHLRSCRHLKS